MNNQWGFLIYMLALLAVMYFITWWPQSKEQKKRKAMLEGLKKGDKIVTVGGIHGTITEFKDTTLMLKIANNVEVEINRTAVGYVKKAAPENPKEKKEEPNPEKK